MGEHAAVKIKNTYRHTFILSHSINFHQLHPLCRDFSFTCLIRYRLCSRCSLQFALMGLVGIHRPFKQLHNHLFHQPLALILPFFKQEKDGCVDSTPLLPETDFNILLKRKKRERHFTSFSFTCSLVPNKMANLRMGFALCFMSVCEKKYVYFSPAAM